MKFKRREMLITGIAGVVAAPLGAQDETPLDQVRKTMKLNREAIEKMKVPMFVEPAFVFKA